MIANHPRVRVLICSRYALFREGIKALLWHADGIEVVGDTCNGKRGLKLVARLHPDVVLIEASEADIIRRIRNVDEHIKILILSPYDDEHLALEGMSAGAAGYIRKDVESEQLKRTIHNVCKGATFAA